MKQLKPCPRCGGEGRLELIDAIETIDCVELKMAAWHVACRNKGCGCETEACRTTGKAIGQWNDEFPRKEDWSIGRVIFVGVPLVLLYFYALVWSMLEFYSFVEGWIKNG
jgi:hypothetical protein